MSFIEERLNLGIDYGTAGGPRYNTSIITDGGGGEQRNINWSQSLGRWQIGGRSLTRSELDYLLNFHENVKGSAIGFRFKDWGDYSATNQLIAVGNGSTQSFQMFKRYEIGSYFVNRPITKIVSGMVNIYFNGVEIVSGWTVNPTTGVVTFTAPPASGTIIAADFEFDVPVRFEQDSISFRFEGANQDDVIFSLDQLSLVEIRNPSSISIPLSIDPVPQFINETLNLGYDYGTVGGPQFNTSIYSVGASFEKRVSNWNESRGRWNIGDRSLTRSELDYFISFFRIARGAGIGFNFYDWQSEKTIPVRFETDEISFRFDAFNPDTGEVIFYLGGVSVVERQLKVHLFGTYLSKGGPFNGVQFVCNGGCDVYNFWRTIDPIKNFSNNYSLVVKNGFWYVAHEGEFYQIDFIYSNLYLAQYTGAISNPHGVGIQYVAFSGSCIQSGFYTPAYGDNLNVTFTVRIN